MTFLELRTLVLDWLDDVDQGYFTNVNQYINNAQQEAQKVVLQAFEGQFEKCVETTMVENQQEYQLPADFKKLVKLEILVSAAGASFQNEDPYQLAKITSSQRNKFDRVGTPTTYYFKNNQLILVPAPDSTNNGKTLRLVYTYRLADLSADGDVSEVPVEYHEYIAVLAAIDGLAKDGRDPGTLLAKKAKYEKDIKKDAEQRYIDSPRTIVQTMDDDYEGDYY